MGIDAVALLRISRPTALALRKDGVDLSLLSDGAKVSSFFRFDEIEVDPVGAVLWMHNTLGDALDEHDDPRGVFLYPDVCEPRGRRYANIVAEVADAGVWVQPAMPDQEAIEQRDRRMEEELDRWAEIRRRLVEAEKSNPEGYIEEVMRTFPLRDDERALLERQRSLMSQRIQPVEIKLTEEDLEAAAGLDQAQLARLEKEIERQLRGGGAQGGSSRRAGKKRKRDKS